MTVLTDIPRVIIAGAGPGGLAAASLLREAGAAVTVLERTAPGVLDEARRASVVLKADAWDILEHVGGGGILADAANVVSPTEVMASLRRIDGDLAAHAERLGVEIRRGVQLDAVAGTKHGVRIGVTDARTGASDLLDADWFIDATGGRSPLQDDVRFVREVTRGALELQPAKRTFAIVRAGADETRGVGWQTADRSSWAINDRTEGVVHAYRAVQPGEALPSADELLRGLDIDPATRQGEVRRVTVAQTVAPHAAAGRMLLIGDSVGTVLPNEQAGTMLALTDAERAAQLVLGSVGRSAEDVDRAVAAYDAQTVAMHRAFLR